MLTPIPCSSPATVVVTAQRPSGAGGGWNLPKPGDDALGDDRRKVLVGHADLVGMPHPAHLDQPRLQEPVIDLRHGRAVARRAQRDGLGIGRGVPRGSPRGIAATSLALLGRRVECRRGGDDGLVERGDAALEVGHDGAGRIGNSLTGNLDQAGEHPLEVVAISAPGDERLGRPPD